MTRNRWLAVGCVVAVCVGVVAVVLLMARPRAVQGADDGRPGSVSLSEADVHAIESGSVSQYLAPTAVILIPEARDSFQDDNHPLLPAESQMVIDSDSATGFQDSASTVNATVTGPQPGAFALELNYADDHWLLSSAVSTP